MQPIYKEREIDLRATFEAMGIGDYIYQPFAGDLSPIRAAVCRVAKDFSPKVFEVHKTLNGYRIDRTA